MNVTELARILRVTPQELRDYLPEFGFDIGQKAIKINSNVASKIIKEWPRLRRKIQMKKEMEKVEREKQEKKELLEEKRTVTIPHYITIKNLSAQAKIPLSKILAQLMKIGVFASLNEKIDFDTAWLVGQELGLDVQKLDEDEEDDSAEKDKLKEVLEKQGDKLGSRPPVVVVMGHVDHGKTKLLDAIRKADVVAGEAGGITQHIGAYQIEKNDKKITFIDTPGHEAFTAMRSRGAKIADVAILVVAADDGVKPQTVEAYRIIEKAGLPLIVAINKIDKPAANIEKTKQELSGQLNLLPEDWGGKTICAPVSAINGDGISELLEMILLVADLNEGGIKANALGDTVGSVIESHVDKGAGPVATILVQNGTLKVGDDLNFNGVDYGRVRALNNYKGEKIDKAGPSKPAQIIGLKTLPEVGDILEVGRGKKVKLKKMKNLRKEEVKSAMTDEEGEEIKKINVIIKSDVMGSAGAIEESLRKLDTTKIKVKVLHKGLGNIAEGDIKRAMASNGIVLGFNVKLPVEIEEMARTNKVEIKLYSVIYDLINDIREKMEESLDPEVETVYLGSVKVKAIFRTEAKRQIVGGKVNEGKIEKEAKVYIERDGEVIDRGTINTLQAGKQDVSFCEKDEECGLEYIGRPEIQDGDLLKFYKEIKTEAKL